MHSGDQLFQGTVLLRESVSLTDCANTRFCVRAFIWPNWPLVKRFVLPYAIFDAWLKSVILISGTPLHCKPHLFLSELTQDTLFIYESEYNRSDDGSTLAALSFFQQAFGGEKVPIWAPCTILG
ncbi:hypothetical protein Y032_0003g1564 [Ancylostoma ceylanicum]|uniref:Uncharacterized protein n=1 Tax=Ancylostoma ceylanicum TaxID=53326 RepID=A0A016VZH2_9BILA|nr:hypothetical protein Y032_0003g1564 [Ancylostoma ceylanicum]